MLQLRVMKQERSIPIRSHGEHISERNKHLIKAGVATVGAVAAVAVEPWAGAVVGAAAIREVFEAIDHHEDRKKK